VTFNQGLDRLATPRIKEPDGLNWHYRQGWSALESVLAAEDRALNRRNRGLTGPRRWTGASSAALSSSGKRDGSGRFSRAHQTVHTADSRGAQPRALTVAHALGCMATSAAT
jgi:hypothetical protein